MLIKANFSLKKRQVSITNDSKESGLSNQKILNFLGKHEYKSPFLLMNCEHIKTKYMKLKEVIPNVEPLYALKANANDRVIKTLKSVNSGFEIASTQELNLLLNQNICSKKIFYSNPVKSKDSIQYATKRGISYFAFDCKEEMVKVFSLNKLGKLILRIDVPNVGSDWPLSSKFGAKKSDINSILKCAKENNIRIYGISFHVGSQCRNIENWRIAIRESIQLFNKLKKLKHNPKMLNIGGGFPVLLTRPIPSIESIGKIINKELESLPKGLEIVSEPGRYIVSDSAVLVCKVICSTIRSGERWAYIDSGVFGGLLESSQGLSHPVFSQNEGKKVPYHLAGPTCDSYDIVSEKVYLPEALKEGDFIFFKNSGAYTTSYASNFNGFPLPKTYFI